VSNATDKSNKCFYQFEVKSIAYILLPPIVA
jgi:hypothetical protein